MKAIANTSETHKDKQVERVYRPREELIDEQNAVMASVLGRFVIWLSTHEDVCLSRDVISQFWKSQNRELAALGLLMPLNYGKHRGKTYQELWMTVPGRNYLTYLASLPDAFSEVKTMVAICREYFKDIHPDCAACKFLPSSQASEESAKFEEDYYESAEEDEEKKTHSPKKKKRKARSSSSSAKRTRKTRRE